MIAGVFALVGALAEWFSEYRRHQQAPMPESTSRSTDEQRDLAA